MKKIAISEQTRKNLKTGLIATGAVVAVGVGLYFFNKTQLGENAKNRLAETLVGSMINHNNEQFVSVFAFNKTVPAELKDEFDAFIKNWMAKLP